MKLIVKDTKDLRFSVYVIGYPDRGESQVMIIFDQKTELVYFTAVIDCYTSGNLNQTVAVLNSRGVKHVDMFCWTHTDEDHSMGIDEIIDTFCTKNTLFVLPEGVYGNKEDFVAYNPAILKTFEKINDFNKRADYNVTSASVAPEGNSQLKKLVFSDTLTDVIFKIVALAPSSPLIRRRWETGVKKKNDISIALLVYFGEILLFFSGDIEDQTIRQIPAEYFEGLSYLKTPHHTSTSSASLLKKFEEIFEGRKMQISCSTIYKTFELPDEDLIESYRKYTDKFYSTGEGTGHPFGVIEVEYDIVGKLITKEHPTGNAVRLY